MRLCARIPATVREAEAQSHTAWMQGVEALSYATFASWCVTLSTQGLVPCTDVVSGFAAPYRGITAAHKGVAAGKFGDPGVPGETRETASAAAPLTGKPGELSEPGNPGDHASENPTR